MAMGDAPAPVDFTATAGSTSSVALPANGYRLHVVMCNTHATDSVWVSIGSDAQVGYGYELEAKGKMVISIKDPGKDTWAKDSIHVLRAGSADVTLSGWEVAL